MKHYYCSTFSKDYVYKGLLLYNSLERFDKDFHFFIICLHEEVKSLLEKISLKNATIITLDDIEKDDAELLLIKESRSDKEYAWTSKASACLYILKRYTEVDHIVWLDGDTFFYSNPDTIFDEWGNYSIMLTEERWREPHKKMGVTNGFYNTGFMGFKRDANALKCLQWFRARLLEWCYDKWENGLWSDQVYVNDWLNRFENVGVIKNMGVNVTPYIIGGSKVDMHDGSIYIDNEELVFFHYYGFKYLDGNEFDLCGYKMNLSDDVIKWLYFPYIHASKEMMELIRGIDNNFYDIKEKGNYFIRNYFNLEINENYTPDRRNICTILSKNYLAKGLALHSSLLQNTSEFNLWILCADNLTYDFLRKANLPNTTLLSLRNIEDKKLFKVRNNRKTNEFCWTLKAPFIQFLLKNNVNLDSILYADGDLFFFKDIKSIYEDWSDHSIYISKLWMNPKSEKMYGSYSAGLIGFKRDKNAFKCLKWWKKNCIKWCYDRIRPGRWSDQKYLDKWPELFSNIRITDNQGINAGPWNIKHLQIVRYENKVYLNNNELIVYHFSGFNILSNNEFDLCSRRRPPKKAVRYIYKNYIAEIKKAIELIQLQDSEFSHNFYLL
ncbi:MAG: hypothetical protein Q8942_08905 [Bacillota bacterium]|nr:hypothetical protein [Bacillota bacterium]